MTASRTTTPAGMTRLVFPAMGTRVEVMVPAQDVAATHLARTLFEEWERRLSRFRPDSELCGVNTRGGGVVSPLLAEVLRSALLAAHETDGLFDPGLERQLVVAGYDRPFTEMDPSAAPRPGTPWPGGAWRRVVLTDRRFARLPEGMHLDLGGIAKGMAVDAAATLLRREGVPGGMVNAGGDLVVWGLPPRRRSWTVAIDGATDLPPVPLRWGALATSSTRRRRWGPDGTACHHTIDPRTGAPAHTDLTQVSVVARTCRDAEVAATACLVLGADGATRFLGHRGLLGLLLTRDGDVTPVGAWPSRRPERMAA